VRGSLRNTDVRFALTEVAREQAAMRDAWRRSHGKETP
jgi:hypothetical protein